MLVIILCVLALVAVVAFYVGYYRMAFDLSKLLGPEFSNLVTKKRLENEELLRKLHTFNRSLGTGSTRAGDDE